MGAFFGGLDPNNGNGFLSKAPKKTLPLMKAMVEAPCFIACSTDLKNLLLFKQGQGVEFFKPT